VPINKKNSKTFFLICGIAAVCYFLWVVRHALYPFIIGLFLAYILNPAVCYVEKKGLPRVGAILVIYILLLTLSIFCGAKLFTLLLRDLESFSKDLPLIVDRIDEFFIQIQSQYQNSALPYSFRLAIDEALLGMENDLQEFIGHLVNSVIYLIQNSIGLAISPILAFYLLHDWYEIKEKLLLIIPGRWRTEIILFFKDVDKVLSGIIRGQLTVACIVGIFVTIGLYFLQLKFIFMIGLLAAIFDIIPYFGPIIGAAPAVLLAILQSPWLTAKVILLFVVIQQIEGNIIHPKIIGENIGLHPLSVIFFVFVGGEVGGLAGMLLGVPVAAIAKVFVQHILKVLL